jgi:hypothetical protein
LEANTILGEVVGYFPQTEEKNSLSLRPLCIYCLKPRIRPQPLNVPKKLCLDEYTQFMDFMPVLLMMSILTDLCVLFTDSELLFIVLGCSRIFSLYQLLGKALSF